MTNTKRSETKTKVKYFGFELPKSAAVFIGTDKDQIRNTLRYYREERRYDWPMPTDEEMGELTEINITAAFPFAKVDHNITAQVRPNVFLHVNANAFGYVEEVAKGYEGMELKRGDLYKFHTLPAFVVFFLPEYIMKGMQEYDWKQHRQQIKEWMEEREATLNEAEQRGIIVRPNKGRSA